MNDLATERLLNAEGTLVEQILNRYPKPWEILIDLTSIIKYLIERLNRAEYQEAFPRVFVHRTVTVPLSAQLDGPAIIEAGVEIRHGAFVRGNVLVGRDSVLGNAVELKHSLLLAACQVPHFNYVGDTVLGRGAHLAAGVIVSNLKADKTSVRVLTPDGPIETGLRKFGAIVGDDVEVGCNSVLNPGTIIGRGSRVYPLSFVRGYVPAGTIYKRLGEIVPMRPDTPI